MPARELETHLYYITLADGREFGIAAAYYQVEDGRVTFKDANHQVVYSVLADAAYEIRRIPETPTADEVMRQIDAGTATREDARKVFLPADAQR